MAEALPNLIIAGVPKGGTTSLFQYLAQHPEICQSDLKELYYFSALRTPGGAPPPLDEYRRHFAHCAVEPYRMEASPSYCYSGKVIIDAIRRTLGEPKILISLRDPVSRFWSAFTFQKSMGRLDHRLSGNEYLDWCLEQPETPGRQTPLSVGRYIDWLPAWVDEFEGDLHVVFAESLFESPLEVITRVLRWLDLTPDGTFDVRPQNPTRRPRSYAAARWAYRAKGLNDRLLASAPGARALLRNLYRKVNTSEMNQPMPESLRVRLVAHYSPHTAQLASYLAGRGIPDLPHWLGAAT